MISPIEHTSVYSEPLLDHLSSRAVKNIQEFQIHVFGSSYQNRYVKLINYYRWNLFQQKAQYKADDHKTVEVFFLVFHHGEIYQIKEKRNKIEILTQRRT